MTTTDPLFQRLDDGSILPNALSRSPWSTNALHGGPVAALLGGTLDALDAPHGFHPGRFTLELLRPVPVEPLRVSTVVVRPGRRVRLLHASLADSSNLVLATATLQQIRIESGCGPASEANPTHLTPDRLDDTPSAEMVWPVDHVAFHSHATEHRSHQESSLGPRMQWIRVTSPLFEGQPLTPYQRALAAADFVNGISNEVTFEQFSFINPDLTVILHRRPRGEWICLDARTTGHGEGIGTAVATLFDEEGEIGLAAQTLLFTSA